MSSPRPARKRGRNTSVGAASRKRHNHTTSKRSNQRPTEAAHASKQQIRCLSRSPPQPTSKVRPCACDEVQCVAVKFGLCVRRQEAANQSYARSHVDSTVLYIPQVFRFFRATLSGFDTGFIVMEYVLGVNFDTLNMLDNPHLAERTMEAIRHLATIPIPPDQGPGPVGGGSAYGYLWSDDGTGQSLESINGMEEWMNKRFDVVKQPRISLIRHQELSMHYMDLVRRNICLLPNFCLLCRLCDVLRSLCV